MEYCTEKQGSVLIVKVKGRLDSTTSPELEKQFADFIDQGETSMIVDLGGMTYVSSTGLRCILTTAKKLMAVQGKFGLCNLQKMAQEVFELSGFSSILPIYDSFEEALAKIEKPL